jgi:hypothetical protein
VVPVDPLAHFTPTEIPGTLAILAIGACLGALVARRRALTSRSIAVVSLLAAFAALGYLGDALGWGDAPRIAVDAGFLAAAAALAFQCLRPPGTGAA